MCTGVLILYLKNRQQIQLSYSRCGRQWNPWYNRTMKRESSSTLSQAELNQLSLQGSGYYPLAQYPPYAAAADAESSSLAVNYSAVPDAARSALPTVASNVDSQTASATYTTPLGTYWIFFFSSIRMMMRLFWCWCYACYFVQPNFSLHTGFSPFRSPPPKLVMATSEMWCWFGGLTLSIWVK